MAAIYKLDTWRTRELYRAIATNNRPAMQYLLNILARQGGLVASANVAREAPEGEIRADGDVLEDESETWRALVNEGEALDRDQSWECLGVWVPVV